MVDSRSSKRTIFHLPQKGVLETMGPDDPLRFYYHPLAGFLFRARIQQALSLLAPPYESILELGYGSGILIPTLASIGKKVSGIDIDSNPDTVMRNLRKIRINASLRRADFCGADFPDESFDLVVAISIFEHIDNLKEAIDKAFRILKPGGHMLVGMPGVNFFMEVASHLVGYHDIKKHHRNNHKQFLALAKKFFNLERYAKMPVWFPFDSGLYFNMYFCKITG